MALSRMAGWGGSPPGSQRCNLQPGRSEPSGELCSSMTATIRRCRGRAPRRKLRPSESRPHAADGSPPAAGRSPRSPSIVTPGASPPSISAWATQRHNDFCLPRPAWKPPAPPRYLVGYSARCYSISRTARAPSSESNFFGMTCIPSNSERMRHQTGKAPRGASTAPGCDPALGLGGRRARFRSGHIRRTGVELTRHPELFNHGSP